jgi:hypothetical protein
MTNSSVIKTAILMPITVVNVHNPKCNYELNTLWNKPRRHMKGSLVDNIYLTSSVQPHISCPHPSLNIGTRRISVSCFTFILSAWSYRMSNGCPITETVCYVSVTQTFFGHGVFVMIHERQFHEDNCPLGCSAV